MFDVIDQTLGSFGCLPCLGWRGNIPFFPVQMTSKSDRLPLDVVLNILENTMLIVMYQDSSEGGAVLLIITGCPQNLIQSAPSLFSEQQTG